MPINGPTLWVLCVISSMGMYGIQTKAASPDAAKEEGSSDASQATAKNYMTISGAAGASRRLSSTKGVDANFGSHARTPSGQAGGDEHVAANAENTSSFDALPRGPQKSPAKISKHYISQAITILPAGLMYSEDHSGGAGNVASGTVTADASITLRPGVPDSNLTAAGVNATKDARPRGGRTAAKALAGTSSILPATPHHHEDMIDHVDKRGLHGPLFKHHGSRTSQLATMRRERHVHQTAVSTTSDAKTAPVEPTGDWQLAQLLRQHSASVMYIILAMMMSVTAAYGVICFHSMASISGAKAERRPDKLRRTHRWEQSKPEILAEAYKTPAATIWWMDTSSVHHLCQMASALLGRAMLGSNHRANDLGPHTLGRCTPWQDVSSAG